MLLREMTMRTAPYPTPGEILLHEFLEPMGITQYRLAKSIDVPQRRIGQIVTGDRAITADTGLRLSRYFGVLPRYLSGNRPAPCLFAEENSSRAMTMDSR